jgi:hypothetical protein
MACRPSYQFWREGQSLQRPGLFHNAPPCAPIEGCIVLAPGKRTNGNVQKKRRVHRLKVKPGCILMGSGLEQKQLKHVFDLASSTTRLP